MAGRLRPLCRREWKKKCRLVQLCTACICSVDMQYDNCDVRDAYRRGARDAYESVCLHIPANRLRELDSWLSSLEAWQDEEPPIPPHRWPEADAEDGHSTVADRRRSG